MTLLGKPVIEFSLAVEALMAAADALSKADEARAAASVYQEIVTRHPYSKRAETAGKILRRAEMVKTTDD